MSDEPAAALRTLIVDDEPLAIERMQVLCAEIDQLSVVGTASDGEAALRLAGYDGALSIEHEDALMSVDEGLGKAVAMLKECIITEPPARATATSAAARASANGSMKRKSR